MEIGSTCLFLCPDLLFLDPRNLFFHSLEASCKGEGGGRGVGVLDVRPAPDLPGSQQMSQGMRQNQLNITLSGVSLNHFGLDNHLEKTVNSSLSSER